MADPTLDPPGSGWGAWALAAGYLLVALALGLGYSGPNAQFTGPPTCGGKVMAPGDTCRESILTTGPQTDLRVNEYSYQQVLARRQLRARQTPWMAGMFVGLVGTVLVFVGMRRLLVARKPRHPGRLVLVGATLPLLAVAALLWPLEMRFDLQAREGLVSSWFFPEGVPGAPFLMAGLAVVGTVATLGARLERAERTAAPLAVPEQVVFGMGGWEAERLFAQRHGVHRTEIGYAGGTTGTRPPDYLAGVPGASDELGIWQGRHARVVRVTFDPAKVSFEELLWVFWQGHDPVRVMGRRGQAGDPSRSAIYATTDEQLAAAKASKQARRGMVDAGFKISTEIAMLDRFWPARAN